MAVERDDHIVTARDRLEAHFRSQPGRFISALTLMRIGGLLAFRTRISELRHQRGLTIENKVIQRRKQTTLSFYRRMP